MRLHTKKRLEDYAETVSDLLQRIRGQLDDRIAALEPLAEEFARLQRAADALDEMPAAVVVVPASASGAAVAVPVPTATRATSNGARRPARVRAARAAPGQTQSRVIEQLRSGPGSTSTAVAGALGISANAAAATISRLVKQGRVRRLETGGYAASET
ncbi:MAG: hypothetical protein QOG42_474 [Solirubrobacteraceae bacterium]|nr:hypothetical protein [Solirubrobacteraceae bacterium]